MALYTGSHLVIQCLKKEGIKRIFTLYYINIVVEGISDCEELVGFTHKR